MKLVAIGLRLQGDHYRPDGDGQWDTRLGELHVFTLTPAEANSYKITPFDVSNPEGVKIGQVYKQTYTRERRTPGRRYVDRRWTSPPRWTFTGGGECDTRKEAVAKLAEKVLRNTRRDDA